MNSDKSKTRSILITGANGGMGKETTKLLLDTDFARIVMACRTEEKATKARLEIINEKGEAASDVLHPAGGFDMNNPEAIEGAINALPSNKPFDVVFLQAGGVIFNEDYAFTKYGDKKVERTVFQNVIGAYITLLNLKRRNLLKKGARIIFAGGEGARGIKGLIDKPNFQSAEALTDYLYGTGNNPKYNPMNAIGVSKLLSALITIKLSEIEKEDMEFVWFSPGLTHGTNGLAQLPPLRRWFMEKVMFGIMALLGLSQSPEAGAKKYVDSILGKIGRSGDVIGAPEGKALGKLSDQKPMNPNFTDNALKEAFWTIVNTVYGDYNSFKPVVAVA